MATINKGLRLANATASAWSTWNGILKAGQFGIETDNLSTTPKYKIGDGVTTWNSLPYANPSNSVTSVFGRTGAVTAQTGDYTTTQVTEGTNLYYTQARFDTAFGLKSTTNLSEGTNLYYTQARFDSAFSAKSTTDLSEGTNLYFTEARVLATVLGAVTPNNSAITTGDSISVFADKTQGQLNNRPTGVSGTAGRMVKYTAAGTIANSVVFAETDSTADYVTLIHNATLSNATSIRGSGGVVRMDMGNNSNNRFLVSTDDHTLATSHLYIDDSEAYLVGGTGGGAANGAIGLSTDIAWMDAKGNLNDINNSQIYLDSGGTYFNTTDVTFNVSTTFSAPANFISTINQTIDSGLTTSDATLMTLTANSTGTPGNNFGLATLFQLETTTTASQTAGREIIYWTNATHASRQSGYKIQLVGNASVGVLQDAFRISNNGNSFAHDFVTHTSYDPLLRFYSGGTIKAQIEVTNDMYLSLTNGANSFYFRNSGSTQIAKFETNGLETYHLGLGGSNAPTTGAMINLTETSSTTSTGILLALVHNGATATMRGMNFTATHSGSATSPAVSSIFTSTHTNDSSGTTTIIGVQGVGSNGVAISQGTKIYEGGRFQAAIGSGHTGGTIRSFGIKVLGNTGSAGSATATNWAAIFDGDVQVDTGNKLLLEGSLTAKGDSYLVYNSGTSEIETFVGGVLSQCWSATATTLGDGINVNTGTTTGTKIGTATTQKIALWGATPVTQRAAITAPSGGATVDTEARTAIDAIRQVLIDIGITA